MIRKEELDNFYKLDEKLYDIHNHEEIKLILGNLKKRFDTNNYIVDDLQEFILKLISWYELKYPDKNLKVSSDGMVRLVHYDMNFIMSFEKLLVRFDMTEYSLYQDFLLNDDLIRLRELLLEMAGWGLIYSRHSNPDFGYFRAIRMVIDFAIYTNYKIHGNFFNEIMFRDYSSDNPDIEILIEKKNMKKPPHKVKKKRRKGLFRR